MENGTWMRDFASSKIKIVTLINYLKKITMEKIPPDI